MSDPSAARDILNVEEAAQLLGVSVKTFSKVLNTESVPARKVGREWKFSRQALIEWVGAGRSDRFCKDSVAGMDDVAPRDDKRRTRGWKIEQD